MLMCCVARVKWTRADHGGCIESLSVWSENEEQEGICHDRNLKLTSQVRCNIFHPVMLVMSYHSLA